MKKRHALVYLLLGCSLHLYAGDAPADWQADADSWCGRAEARARRSLHFAPAGESEAITLNLQLADLARMQGQPDRAEKALQQAFAMAQARLKSIEGDVKDPIQMLVATRYAMGCFHRSQGQYEKAETEFKQARDSAGLLLAADDPNLARAAGAKASTMSARGDLEQARQLCTWAVDHVTKACGTNDAEIAWIDDMMGSAYAHAGQHALALPVYEHMLSVRQAALPPEHPDLADAHNRLASILFELKRPEQIIPHLQQALEIRTQAFGPTHPLTLRSRKNLEEASTPQRIAERP
jgi:tetratricopeptide (TPR) repeat protein